jgi:hypothetical protein
MARDFPSRSVATSPGNQVEAVNDVALLDLVSLFKTTSPGMVDWDLSKSQDTWVMFTVTVLVRCSSSPSARFAVAVFCSNCSSRLLCSRCWLGIDLGRSKVKRFAKHLKQMTATTHDVESSFVQMLFSKTQLNLAAHGIGMAACTPCLV